MMADVLNFFSAGQVAIATTATKVELPAWSESVRVRSISVYNAGAATIELGGSTVAFNSGFPLLAGQSMTFDAHPGGLWGIASGASVNVRILEAV
jgi:hypothetical protein